MTNLTLHYVSKEDQHLDGYTACGSQGWQWSTTKWNEVTCYACLHSKLQADYARLVQAANNLVLNLPEFLIDEAREIWGNTNANIVTNYRNELAAALHEQRTETEKE